MFVHVADIGNCCFPVFCMVFNAMDHVTFVYKKSNVVHSRVSGRRDTALVIREI